MHRERAELEGWESGQDHVALALYNGNEYLEGMLGAYRARVAPFNVNYRYVGEELRYLLNDARPRAMILHSSLAPTLAEVLPTLDSPPDVLLQVEDESGHTLLPGAEWYEEALAASSPDGRTGRAVPRRPLRPLHGGHDRHAQGRAVAPARHLHGRHGRAEGRHLGDRHQLRGPRRSGWPRAIPLRLLILPPLMHGAAQWACFMLMAQGATLVFPDETRRVDPDDVWTTVEREKANTMTIVGDAVLRPLLVQLDKKSYDLSSFFAVGNGGAPLTPAVRAMAVERMPNLVISDSAGSSETGAQMHVTSMDDVAVGVVPPRAGHRGGRRDAVAGARRRATRATGGWRRPGTCRSGISATPDKTARTFPVIDGVRYSIPGDRARLLADGQIELLGRDSVTVNSGGEKIFVEEVERAIAGHPAVADVVVDRPPLGALGPGGGGRRAAGRGGDDRRRRPSWSTPRPTSPATSCPRKSCSWSGSSARPRARRTTAGRPRRRSRPPRRA